MKDEYIIINKTAIQKRVEELEKTNQIQRVDELENVLSQSTPLIPEIEKAFDAAREFDSIDGVVDINIVLNMPSHDLSDLQEKTTKQEYISNLKLDI